MLRSLSMFAIVTTLALAQQSGFARTQDANVIPLTWFGLGTDDHPSAPRGNLLMASDGNFYFTSANGGANTVGSVASLTPAGVVTLLHSFASDNNEGQAPFAGVIAASDGNLYGTTYLGGADNGGSVYRLTLAGVYTTLHSFKPKKPDPYFPYAGLMQASDGNLYGTTLRGGLDDRGTIFRITLDGTFTQLHEFKGDDGENPEGTLVQGSDGNLYGTTLQGGTGNRGTIYRLTLAGAVTSIYSFPVLSEFSTAGIAINAPGANPRAGLLLAADGDFYGTAYQGGPNGYGTVFRITPAGALTVVHAFTGATSGGAFPLAGVTQDAAGNLYGTTERGGAFNQGTAWRITSGGQFSLLHGFTGSIADGYTPYATLVPFNGFLYGATYSDSTASAGAMFKLDVGDGVSLPVEISVAPATIAQGASSTLTWSSPTAASCTTAGAWDDTVGAQGSKVVTPESAGIYNYVLVCTDGAGVIRNAYASLRVDAAARETVDGGGGGGGALSMSLLLLLGGALLRKTLRLDSRRLQAS